MTTLITTIIWLTLGFAALYAGYRNIKDLKEIVKELFADDEKKQYKEVHNVNTNRMKFAKEA